ncbi:MAG: TylF/MycF/NovP-related O-methyltransferase [Sandaracinaceae bacterium]
MTYGVIVGERGEPDKWKNERRLVRRGPGTPYRAWQTLRHLAVRDRSAAARFLAAPYPGIDRRTRLGLLVRFARITNRIRGYHTLSEMLTTADRVFRLAGRPGLSIVEAGAGSGASTAKLSLLVKAAGGTLHVFDTFRGIPENDEKHTLLDGTPIRFCQGAFRGRLGAVKKRVAAHGAIDVCRFHKGLLEDTLPLHAPPRVDVALLDLDLVSSTRVAVETLYPRLRRGGCIVSQDGHLRAVRDLLEDPDFYASMGLPAPPLRGDKLVVLDAP